MAEFIQLVWSGILNGMLYALIGLSLVLIFKTARILNFAAGTMAGFTGWFAWWWATKQGIPFLLSHLHFSIALALVEIKNNIIINTDLNNISITFNIVFY